MGNLFSGDAAATSSPLASGLSPPRNNSKKNATVVAAPVVPVVPAAVTPASSPSFMNRARQMTASRPATPAASPSIMNRMKKALPSMSMGTPKVGGRRRLRGTRKQRKSSRRQQRK